MSRKRAFSQPPKIALQLDYLRSLRDDGLLPHDVFMSCTKLAAAKYLNMDSLKSSAVTSENCNSVTQSPQSPPPPPPPLPPQSIATTSPCRKTSASRVQNDALWTYVGPLVFLLLAIIFTLIIIDWVLGVDQPRLLDYMLNPISTCSTHRTGRVEL